MPHEIHHFKDVTGKIVESVTLTNEPDFRALCIRFTDQTAMHFMLNVRLEVEPELMNLRNGSGSTLIEYPLVPETPER